MAEVDPNKKPKTISTISLSGPMTLWIGLLIIAAALQLGAIPFAAHYGHTGFNSYFNEFANYILYVPGFIALPLIASLWIGERVSTLGKDKSFVAMKGLVNAIYCSIIYGISILIIYIAMVMEKTAPLGTMSNMMFAEYIIGVPVVITLVIIPLFAIIASARRFA